MGLVGSGWQAESQLQAIAAVRSLKQVRVFSRNLESRTQFAARMREQLEVEVIAVDQPQEAIREAPIVVTATSSKTPVLDGNLLARGAMVCAMGSNWLNKAELDAIAVRRAHTVVCDSIECCRNEAGDFVAAIEQGYFDWSAATELSKLLTSGPPNPSTTGDITIFKSVGMAIEDIAVGAKLVELAEKVGLGKRIEVF